MLRAVFTVLSMAGAVVYLLLFALMRIVPDGVVCVWEHNSRIYAVEVIGLLVFLVGSSVFLYEEVQLAIAV